MDGEVRSEVAAVTQWRDAAAEAEDDRLSLCCNSEQKCSESKGVSTPAAKQIGNHF